MTDKPATAAPTKEIPIQGQPHPTETKDSVEIAIESAITKYGPAVALIVCVVVIVSAAAAFWIQRNRNLSGEYWSAVTTNFQDRNVKGLVETAERARSTKAGTVAMLNAGVVELNDGLEKLLKDKVKAKEEIESSIEKIKQALNSEHADQLVKDQANYSLAFAYEALGDFEQALPMYEALAADEDCQFRYLAESAVARCNDPATKEFYKAFSEWTPATQSTAPADLDELLKGGIDSLAPPEGGLDLEDGNQDDAPALPPTGQGTEGDGSEATSETGSDDGEAGTETSSSENSGTESSEKSETDQTSGN